MSVQAMTRVLDYSQATGVTRMVLLLIANHETEERGAFPSVDTIAREARCGERTVQDCITRAKALGELAVDYRAGPHGTNVYRTLCGSRGAAPLPTGEPTPIRTPQNPHPAESRRESAPERKELGVTGSVVPQTSEGGLTLAPSRRDEVFEAVAEVCGIDWRNGLTKAGRAPLNVAVADLKSAGATPDEVRRRAALWPFDAVMTPTALAKHWPQLSEVRPTASASTRHMSALADRLEAEGR